MDRKRWKMTNIWVALEHRKSTKTSKKLTTFFNNITNIDKELVQKILHDKLNMKKVCAKMVLKNFTQDQKNLNINSNR